MTVNQCIEFSLLGFTLLPTVLTITVITHVSKHSTFYHDASITHVLIHKFGDIYVWRFCKRVARCLGVDRGGERTRLWQNRSFVLTTTPTTTQQRRSAGINKQQQRYTTNKSRSRRLVVINPQQPLFVVPPFYITLQFTFTFQQDGKPTGILCYAHRIWLDPCLKWNFGRTPGKIQCLTGWFPPDNPSGFCCPGSSSSFTLRFGSVYSTSNNSIYFPTISQGIARGSSRQAFQRTGKASWEAVASSCDSF